MLRTGQELFNFLEWLHVSKGFTNEQSGRMADPFFIKDADWVRLWFEYGQSQREQAAAKKLNEP